MMSDDELVEGCVRNESKTQEMLFKTFSSKMLAVCLRYVASREEAEDVLQNGFIKVFRKISSYRNQGSLEGWIKRIMVNTALDELRKGNSLRFAESIDSDTQIASHYVSMEQLEAKDLMKMIQSLPKGFRTVFNLYAIEGYSHKEIGEILGVSESTSKSQYSRARAYLQKMLSTEKVI